MLPALLAALPALAGALQGDGAVAQGAGGALNPIGAMGDAINGGAPSSTSGDLQSDTSFNQVFGGFGDFTVNRSGTIESQKTQSQSSVSDMTKIPIAAKEGIGGSVMPSIADMIGAGKGGGDWPGWVAPVGVGIGVVMLGLIARKYLL